MYKISSKGSGATEYQVKGSGATEHEVKGSGATEYQVKGVRGYRISSEGGQELQNIK